MGTPTCCAFEGGSVIGFKDGKGGVKQVALRNYDDVIAPGDLVTAKNFSNQSLGPVTLDRAAELSRGCDPKPPDFMAVWQDEQRAVSAVDARPARVHCLKIRSTANPLGGTKPGHWRIPAGPTRSTPSVAYVLSRGGA